MSTRIGKWMKTELVTISKGATVQEAINLLIEKKVGTLPVIETGGKLCGVVTMKMILERCLPDFFHLVQNIDFIEDFGALEIPSGDILTLLKMDITEIMEKKPPSISGDYSILSAINIMTKYRITDLLIVEHGILKGLVSSVDLGVAFLHWIKENTPLFEANSNDTNFNTS